MESGLLNEIQQFLRATGMGPTYFGKLAAGNTELVGRLQAGKTITLRTAERARRFMAERRAST
jgi:hypothetical protein